MGNVNYTTATIYIFVTQIIVDTVIFRLGRPHDPPIFLHFDVSLVLGKRNELDETNGRLLFQRAVDARIDTLVIKMAATTANRVKVISVILVKGANAVTNVTRTFKCAVSFHFRVHVRNLSID